MKTTNFETPAQMIERLQATATNYRNILDGLKNVIQRHNWCVVDADFEAFAVRKDAKDCLTFGDDPDFYIKADAEEIAEKAVYRRNDSKRVNLKVMSERSFFEMKLRKTEEALQLFKQYAA